MRMWAPTMRETLHPFAPKGTPRFRFNDMEVSIRPNLMPPYESALLGRLIMQ